MTPELDEQWIALQGACAEAGRQWSQVDWMKAWHGAWKVLDFEQKQAAVDGYRARKGTEDWCLTVAPLVYLRDRLWQRTVERPRKANGRVQETPAERSERTRREMMAKGMLREGHA